MKKFILLPLLVAMLSSCNTGTNTVVQETDRSSSGGSTVDSGTGSDTSTPDEEYNVGCTAEGNPRSSTSSANDYIRMEAIAHGLNTVTTGAPTLAWSSSVYNGRYATNVVPSNFTTDSVLKVRLMALPSPARGATDSFGNTCKMEKISTSNGFTKLKATIGVREYGSSTIISSRTLYNIDINDCSETVSLTVPPNSSSRPFVIEVYNVEWDYSCAYGGGSGYGCPMGAVWEHDCVSFEVQMETDNTMMIPDKE